MEHTDGEKAGEGRDEEDEQEQAEEEELVPATNELAGAGEAQTTEDPQGAAKV